MNNTGEELDPAVVAAAAQGDRSALAQVLESIRPLWCGIAVRVSGRPNAANSPRTTSRRRFVWPS